VLGQNNIWNWCWKETRSILYGHLARSVEEACYNKDGIIAGRVDRIIMSDKYEIASSGNEEVAMIRN
jgi:hypothetical protein